MVTFDQCIVDILGRTGTVYTINIRDKLLALMVQRQSSISMPVNSVNITKNCDAERTIIYISFDQYIGDILG